MCKNAMRYSVTVVSLFTCVCLVGCGPPPEYNTVLVTADQSAYVTGKPNPVGLPIFGANIDGKFDGWISANGYYDIGSATSFSGTTVSAGTTASPLGAFSVPNMEVPATWDVTWENDPTYCVNQADITQWYPVPYESHPSVYPSTPTVVEAQIPLICFVNDPTHPDFIPTHVSPQFSLDDAPPSSLWVASLDQIPSGGTTTLSVYDMSLNNVATMTASSLSGNGDGAYFPYPSAGPSSPLPPGAYITALSNQIGTYPTTVHGMEPLYIAHDDTSYPGAFGVAVASPETIITRISYTNGPHNICLPGTITETTTGGVSLPLVTLLTQNELAIGNSTTTVAVGVNPTVVIPFNDNPTSTSSGRGLCGPSEITSYSGAQSALVVNTGSNSISVLNIGTPNLYPSGTVLVGNQPVAAVISSDETMAYIANYADGTISEVNLSTLTQTRVMSVMSNPASLTFDGSGNLWVGGQGIVDEVNIGTWTITASNPVDGTINGMTYDSNSGTILQNILQNGSVSNPSNGTTFNARVAFSGTASQSYSTMNNFNPATGTSSVAMPFGDNAAYSLSSVVGQLAFPAQLPGALPVYTSTNGDLTASVSGNSFVVSIVGTGQIVIQGVLPFPARGVAMTSSMIYFTMPESNSLVSLPIQIP